MARCGFRRSVSSGRLALGLTVWRAAYADAVPFGGVGLLLAIQLMASAASAQTWRIEPSTRATVTATNNSGYVNGIDTGSDVMVELTPRVTLKGQSARFRLDAFVQADSLIYLNNTVSDELNPRARLALNTTAIERWLYLDVGAGIQQVASNPYVTVSNGSFPSIRLDTAQYRLSPYLDHEFSPTVSVVYRNDNIWTRRSDTIAAADPRRDSLFQSNTFALTQRPVPFGYALEANQERTKYTNSPDATLQLAAARAILTYAFDPSLAVGLVYGRERNEFALTTEYDTIRGMRVRWRPSERTDLNASVERRFFDKGWDVLWSHRSPFLAVNVNLNRQPASQPTSFLVPAAGSNFRSLVDAAYTTRYPNPVERAVIVDNAIAAFGASATATGPIEAYSDYAQVQQRATVSVAFLSPLTALTFQLFTVKSEQLQRNTASTVPLPPTVADNTQLGGSVAFNRRLTSTASIEATVSGVKVEGIGASQGLASSSKTVRLTGTQAMGPKTQVFAGARRQISSSTVVRPTQERALFLGVDHKF